MELFIPSLVVLVVAAVIIFLILPKLSPYILGVLAIAFLVAGVIQHYFGIQYKSGQVESWVEQAEEDVLDRGLLPEAGSSWWIELPGIHSACWNNIQHWIEIQHLTGPAACLIVNQYWTVSS